MATFVLIAGAWCGGWAWKEVATLLRDAGHEVYSPTLTGLGEREHLARPDIDLCTHITDVVNMLRYEDLGEVVLVGWSYAGMVITGVAERVPERLAHLVYLDAFVPYDGEAAVDIYTQADALRAYYQDMLERGVWRFPHDPPDAPRRVDHPVKTILQPLHMSSSRATEIPRTFIYCTKDKADNAALEAITVSAQRAKAADWHFCELESGHCAVWDMPQETSALLLALAT